MARQDALQGSLPLLVLKLLARRGPLHGYGIATQIEGMSDETLRVEEGSLYPALHRLEEASWIEARWTKTGTGRRARVHNGRPGYDRAAGTWVLPLPNDQRPDSRYPPSAVSSVPTGLIQPAVTASRSGYSSRPSASLRNAL